MRSPEELALIAGIADDLPAGVWVATAPEGRFVYANRVFEEIMGIGPIAEVGAGGYAEPYGIFRRDGRLYPEENLPFARALVERTTVVVDDIVIHRRDGRRVFVRATAKPILDDLGTITHIAIAFFDISREVEAEAARTRAQAEEAEARDRLSRVVENAPIVLYSYDQHAIVTLVQGHGLRRLGREPRDMLGRNVFDLFRDVPDICDSTRRALSGETLSHRVQIGSAVFDSWLMPLRNETGAVTGVLGVSTDVTDVQRMEIQLARAERLASVGMLAAGVAHEINNPLSYVATNLDLAVAELGRIEDPKLQRSLEEKLLDARQGAGRVRAIVRDLRVFAGAEKDRPGVADVRAALDSAIKVANIQIQHRARLVLHVEPVDPVATDPGRLAQLLLNLLINAAQAIPEGASEKNEIRVSVAPDTSGFVRIEIEDSGAGIPADVLPRIFDPFFTTKAVGEGTGLGLSISQGIATTAGGRIEVDSRPGVGSTFRVLLPRAKGGAEPKRRVRSAAPGAPRRGTVLVIDDEPLILKVISSVLEGEHDVTCESRADVALERIRRGERFDAILCDLMLPHFTGMDLHAALVALAPEQARATLFLTGGAFSPQAREFVERVQESVIEKPFEAATLLSRVRGLLADRLVE